MSAARVMLIGAVLWASAFILSATVFRGNRVGDWVEGTLLVVWIVFFSSWAGKQGRNAS